MKVKLPPNVLKLCLMGDGGVGKTTLCNRILTGVFNPTTKMTIGIDFQILKMDILDPFSDDEKKVNLEIQIWDFGGQQHFRFIQPRFLKNATGGLLLYDVSRFSTTKDLKEWKKLWDEQNDSTTPLYLIGSKSDTLNKGAMDIEENKLSDLKNDFNADRSFLVSSKSGYSIDALIDTIAKDMYIYNVEKQKSEENC